MKVSVIISFYNKIDFLMLLIAGFERQSFKDFEIIISDDGSREDVVEEVRYLIKSSSLNIVHNWHEDHGWRKNIILNKSIQRAKGECLVFIDGDCIPHRDFVKDHYLQKAPNTILAGRRVKLSAKISNQLDPKKVANGWIERKFFTTILWDGLFGKSKHLEKGIRLSFPFLKNSIDRQNPLREILGCNFSVHKQDLLSINGFDERYLGPCLGEDNDIDLRFSNQGGEVRFLKFCAIQYHIDHPLLSRASMAANEEIYEYNKTEKVTYTPFGIQK